MIIQRYIAREVGVTFAGVSLLLVLMYLSGTFVRLLAEAMEGDFPADLLFAMFALKGGGNIVFILPLSLFLAVMLALGRLYQDSEMAAMQACGVDVRLVMKSVGIISLLIALLVGGMTLFVAPWAENKSYELLDEARTRSEFDTVAAGRFTPLGDDGPLLYIEERVDEGESVSGVFAQHQAEGRKLIFSASKASRRVDAETGYRYLVLHDGYRYEGNPGQRDYQVVKFEEYGFRLRDREVVATARPRHAISSRDLVKSPDRANQTELHWRIAMPISTVLLGLLGVLISKTSPRQGRFGKLFIGIIIYLVYNNLLTVGRSMIGGGELPIEVGLWWVHGLLLLMIVVLYRQQQTMRGPRVKTVKVA